MARRTHEEDLYVQLGRRIREMRIARGLTQENLANAVGTNSSHISNIENNHSHVSLPLLIDISKELQVSIDYLLRDDQPREKGFLEKDILIEVQSSSAPMKLCILEIIKILKDTVEPHVPTDEAAKKKLLERLNAFKKR